METIKNFFRAIWDFIGGFFGYLVDVLIWVPRWVVSRVFDALLSIINAIEAPAWLGNIDSLFAGIPSGVWWFASVGQFGFGLSLIGSALLLRFVIRRLPIIG